MPCLVCYMVESKAVLLVRPAQLAPRSHLPPTTEASLLRLPQLPLLHAIARQRPRTECGWMLCRISGAKASSATRAVQTRSEAVVQQPVLLVKAARLERRRRRRRWRPDINAEKDTPQDS